MTSQLPKVKIDGKEFIMDARLKEFRKVIQKENPILEIKRFDELSDKDKIELVYPRQIITAPGKVTSCLTQREHDALIDLNIKNKKILKKIPICEE